MQERTGACRAWEIGHPEMRRRRMGHEAVRPRLSAETVKFAVAETAKHLA